MSIDNRELANAGLLEEEAKRNVRLAFEDDVFKSRVRYPTSPEESASIVSEIANLARLGKHIALVDGSFDVPQPNHQWYLQHARLLAAKDRDMSKGGSTATDLELAANDDIVLVVTLDTDEKIGSLKAGRDNNDSPRPVYPWDLRAQHIGNFMTPMPGGFGLFRPVVDIITIDGDTTEQGTPHESHLAFAAALMDADALHTWIFFGEHEAKINMAQAMIETQQGQPRVCVVPVDLKYSVDSNGEGWKSSGIIARIRGDGGNSV